MALPREFLPSVAPHEYLRVERTNEVRHEYLNGLVYMMAGESPDHSRICFNLASIVGGQIAGGPCEGFSPNMKVRTGEGNLYAYPDLIIAWGKSEFHDEHGDVLLNPTAIFEVLSPSTERYDRGEKFMQYRKGIASLHDYVLVSQFDALVEHYSRQDDDTWLLREVSGLEGLLVLESIGCSVPLSDMYSRTRLVAQESAQVN